VKQYNTNNVKGKHFICYHGKSDIVFFQHENAIPSKGALKVRIKAQEVRLICYTK
jgi:hypothetical protein